MDNQFHPERGRKPTIGILTLQGAVQDHFAPLAGAGAHPVSVRSARELALVDGLIIPGGESTVMGRFLHSYGMVELLRDFGQGGFPIWGICAGSILLAREVLLPRPALIPGAVLSSGEEGSGEGCAGETEPGKTPGVLALLPMMVERNSYGRQLASREILVQAPGFLGSAGEMMPFIRAPRFFPGEELRIIAWTGEGSPTGVLGGPEENILATSFHPELTEAGGFHRWMVEKALAWRQHGRFGRAALPGSGPALTPEESGSGAVRERSVCPLPV